VVIARTWRGAVRAEDADRYLAYLEETGLANYRTTPGNRGATVFRRILGSECEFLILSLWESRKAIEAFAGEEIGVARFYPEDDRFLVNRDLSVNHYEVVWADLPGVTASGLPS
jgi:heme-degrading monooxygenase HmoA